MIKQKFLVNLFVTLFLLIFIFYPISLKLSSLASLLSAVVLGLLLVRFIHTSKVKKVGNIKIEEVIFSRNFLFRSFFHPKDLWVVYDKRIRSFRPADFRDMPKEVGIFFILGIFLLYTSYTIVTNLFSFPLLLPLRASILVIIAVLGVYSFFVSMGRIAAMLNKKNIDVAKMLNKNRNLKNFIRKHKAYVEVTPSFNREGIVSSVEFVTPKNYETEKVEKLLLDVSRALYRHK